MMVDISTQQTPSEQLATPALPAELLRRVDENLWCHAVNDNHQLPIDLEGALLFQTTEAIEVKKRLEQLASMTPAVPPALLAPVTALTDAVFRHLVETLAVRPPDAPLSPPAHVIDVLARLVDTLAVFSTIASESSSTRATCPPESDTCASS